MIRLAATMTLALSLATPQDAGPKLGKITETGRLKKVQVNIGGADPKEYLVSWRSPATPGDIQALEVVLKDAAGARHEGFNFHGVEHGELRLGMIAGRQGTNAEEKRLGLPAFEGKYYYYPPALVESRIGFKITPHSPSPGLFDIELIAPK